MSTPLNAPSPEPAQLALADDWQRLSPDDAGFAPNVGELLDDGVKSGKLANLHAVVVVRHGKLVLERYYAGPDERRGEPLGTVTFGPDVKHDLRSISKSVVGLLYGIALDEGQVPALDRPLVDQFPAYADLARDPERRRMTIAHALSMTLGTEWDELSVPYVDARNSEIAMEMAKDSYRFVLDRPIIAEPGSRWTYNSGTTALLGHLIAAGTGMPLPDFARAKLFAPLGVRDIEWVLGSNGEPAAASGLRMRPRDLARIGQLVLDRGRWGDRQIVPADWLDQSFAPRIPIEDGLDYGYQWWLGRAEGGQPWIAGFGNGGQRLTIIPSRQLVVAILAGNYNAPDAWQLPAAILSEILLPALRSE